MASMLKAQGYRSAAIGKWHLGYSKDWNQLPITGPLEVGFDYHFGVPQNHNDHFRVFIENHDIVGRKPGEAFRVVKGRAFREGIAQPRVDDQVGRDADRQGAAGSSEENRDKPVLPLFHVRGAPHPRHTGGPIPRHQPRRGFTATTSRNWTPMSAEILATARSN